MRRSWVVLGIGVAVTAMAAGCSRSTAESAEALQARADRLAHETLLLDAHVDLPYRLQHAPADLSVRTAEGHFDLVRAREGGLDAAFMSIYVPADLQGTGEERAAADGLIDLVEELVAANPDTLVIARSPREVRDAFDRGLIALPLGIENGAPIGSLDDLRHFRDRGVRYVTLTHSANNLICDSSFADEARWNGVSPYGREVVAEMNRLGMMIDVSHASDAAFDQVLELSRAPVIASHSSCRHLTPGFERNLDDARIRRLAEAGGVIQVTFGSAFLTAAANARATEAWQTVGEILDARGLAWDSAEAREIMAAYEAEHPPVVVTVSDLADHIDHVVQLVGIEHVGLGSDFDGIDDVPEGMEDVSAYPRLVAELLRRGYSDADVAAVCGGNLLRVWEAVERAAEPS